MFCDKSTEVIPEFPWNKDITSNSKLDVTSTADKLLLLRFKYFKLVFEDVFIVASSLSIALKYSKLLNASIPVKSWIFEVTLGKSSLSTGL